MSHPSFDIVLLELCQTSKVKRFVATTHKEIGVVTEINEIGLHTVSSNEPVLRSPESRERLGVSYRSKRWMWQHHDTPFSSSSSRFTGSGICRSPFSAMVGDGR